MARLLVFGWAVVRTESRPVRALIPAGRLDGDVWDVSGARFGQTTHATYNVAAVPSAAPNMAPSPQPIDEFHDQGALFDPVDGRDVGVVERRENKRRSFEAGHTVGSAATDSGRTLTATSRPSLVSVARQTSPIPPSPSLAVIL